MPTAKAEGTSKEVYVVDALPAAAAGTAHVGEFGNDRDVGTGVELLASAARTADATGADVTNATFETARALLIVCDVTAQSGTAPTLDVAIQAKIDGSYTTLARFSIYAAATGKKCINVKRDLSFATEITLAADPAVSTGLLINNHDWSNILRAKVVITGTTPSFTFAVTAYPVK